MCNTYFPYMKVFKFIVTTALLILICFGLKSQVRSDFPSNAVDCVVLLEKEVNGIYQPHGTGFILKSYNVKQPTIIVTNEHVLRNRSIYITIPADSSLISFMKSRKTKTISFRNRTWELIGQKLRTEFVLIQDSTFVSNKEFDIAVFKLNIANNIVIEDTLDIKVSPILGLGLSSIKYKKDVPLGTDVFFVGFPFAIGTELGWYHKGFTRMFSESVPSPLVRKGSVAWKSSYDNTFLLDAFSYTGNSGSPIFTSTEMYSTPYLIGIIRGHLPSEKSENIGLAVCTWTDEIFKLINKLK